MRDMDDDEFYQRLRRLVGRRFTLADGEWQVVDVLPQDGALVIQCLEGAESRIQADAYGNPTRRCPDPRLIRVFDETGRLSPEGDTLLRALRA